MLFIYLFIYVFFPFLCKASRVKLFSIGAKQTLYIIIIILEINNGANEFGGLFLNIIAGVNTIINTI